MSVNAVPNEATLQRLVADAVWATFAEDPDFMSNQVAEVSMVAPIFCRMYLRGVAGHRVDLEYDREGGEGHLKDGTQRDDGHWEGWKRPDVVVHQRGHDNANLLVIEFKITEDSQVDIQKVKNLMGLPKKYRFGATVVLNPEGGLPKWRWFSNPHSEPLLAAVPQFE